MTIWQRRIRRILALGRQKQKRNELAIFGFEMLPNFDKSRTDSVVTFPVDSSIQ